MPPVIQPDSHRPVTTLLDRPSAAGAVLLLVCVLLGACGGAAPAPEIEPRRAASTSAYRTTDSLLVRPELQRLVDLQLARDAEALMEALRDPDAAARARAAFALGSVQAVEALPALVRALADPSARVRADAAFALGQTPDTRGARALLERVTVETDTTVLVRLLDALGRVGGPDELSALLELDPVRARGRPAGGVRAAYAMALARFGLRSVHHTDAVDWLVGALRADELEVRQNAAYYFGRVREADAWAHRRRWIVRALDDYAPDDRSAGFLLLGLARLEDQDDVGRMARWLAGAPDWTIRVSAARALARRIDSESAREALIAALEDPSHHVRTAAAEALAGAELEEAQADSVFAAVERNAEEPQVVGPLLSSLVRQAETVWQQRVLDWILAHPEPPLRRAAADALARIGGRSALNELTAMSGAADPRLAAAAVDALHARFDEGAAADAGTDATPARYYRTFATALRRGDVAISAAAARALADSAFVGLGAGPLLQSAYLQMSMPADAEAMAAVLDALGVLGDSSALPLLREAWSSSRSTPVLQAAARALGALTGADVDVPERAAGPTPSVEWQWLAHWGRHPTVALETARGLVVLQLDVEQAPQTAANVLRLVTSGEYDGVPFHRVVPNFVIQGGDYVRGDGYGGPDRAIRSEFTRIPYLRGTAGMASAGKDTEGSQYFVTHSMQPHLDGRYSAFAVVIEGLDVVDAIRAGDIVISASAEPEP